MPIDPAQLKADILARIKAGDSAIKEAWDKGSDSEVAAAYSAPSPDPRHVAMVQRVGLDLASRQLGVVAAARALKQMTALAAQDDTGETALVLRLFERDGVDFSHPDSALILQKLVAAKVFGDSEEMSNANIAKLMAVGVRRKTIAETLFGVSVIVTDGDVATAGKDRTPKE
jgi:hypothetical protein